MSNLTFFRWERDSDGVVLLTMDDPDQRVNTMGAAFMDALAVVVSRLESERDEIRGVVITSAKKTFVAGGDLHELYRARAEDAPELQSLSLRNKTLLRRLERLGKPVVAAINGAALGGGLELALACHYRIALDTASTEIGLPEVTLGLLPGAGGVVRTVRLLGINEALQKVLLHGDRHLPKQALEIGLIHELADTREEMLRRAKAWVMANPTASQPWDLLGYEIPGGSPSSSALSSTLPTFPALLRKNFKGAPLPAPRNILSAAIEGAQVDIETAFRIETEYFVELAVGQVSKNMIKALFFDMQHIRSGGSRSDAFDTWKARRAGVLGAGMMGAGIAYACASRGIDVVLKDVDLERAERGKLYSAQLLGKAVDSGALNQRQADEVLARIKPTASAADLAGCDLVIEAVFEDPSLKQGVLRELEGIVEPDCLMASNTSTLPVSELAQAVRYPENFIGLHFFSPVDKMPLLEIVVGEKTSEATQARAMDLAKQIHKVPILVKDNRGFFTSRVITQFLDEAVAMVREGVNPASIEQAAVQAGYPAPPLQLLDQLTLSLSHQIRQQFRLAWEAEGKVWVQRPAELAIGRMVLEFDRSGRSAGAGFYDYVEGRRQHLWPGLREAFAVQGYAEIPFDDIQERMLFAEVVDAVRCFEEGVLSSVADANVGSILGIGFPVWTGGVVQYVNQYEGGVTGFVERARELADAYGDHLSPPTSLVEQAANGAQCYTPAVL